MQRYAIVIGLVILCLSFITGCSSGNEDEATVNEQFTSSEEFNAFNESTRQEQDANTSQPSDLVGYLKNAAECESTRQLTIPFEVDSTVINEETIGGLDNCVGADEETSYALFLFGETPFGNIDIKWMMRIRESMYRDWELMAATYEGDQLLNFQIVGSYRENLKEHIFSNIEVNRQGGGLVITANTERDIEYPIEQLNTEYKEFRIDGEGIINEVE
ncbi:hypothetical protein LQ318_03815 [Aliifodinibius salicampi]|uniref:Lipoprotein n=1 Tax=Fodinibius salicampi TaxID=1920655 RepID=A0ABT3PVZ7_9BACT|nr:hypothetical protein [Fodinibius salicampi]MCW9712023.1 hypothetical protein [Fodinibius salicampi]